MSKFDALLVRWEEWEEETGISTEELGVSVIGFFFPFFFGGREWVDCSCGCDHVFTKPIGKTGWCLEFSKCSCPQYRLHTIFAYSFPDWVIPSRWRGETEYYSYLEDPDWKNRAKTRRDELGNRCTVCATTVNLSVHHNTYFNLGRELPIDLTVLCGKHHELFTRCGNLPKYTGFRKGRLFIDKKHCIQNDTLVFLSAMFWMTKLWDEYCIYTGISDPREQTSSFFEFMLDGLWVNLIDRAVEEFGAEDALKFLPKPVFKL